MGQRISIYEPDAQLRLIVDRHSDAGIRVLVADVEAVFRQSPVHLHVERHRLSRHLVEKLIVLVLRIAQRQDFDVRGRKLEADRRALPFVVVPRHGRQPALPRRQRALLVRLSKEELHICPGNILVLVLNPRVDIEAVDQGILRDGLPSRGERLHVVRLAHHVAMSRLRGHFGRHIFEVGHADVADAARLSHVEDGELSAAKVAVARQVHVRVAQRRLAIVLIHHAQGGSSFRKLDVIVTTTGETGRHTKGQKESP